MAKSKSLYGLQDARSMRGIMARGPAKYAGPSHSPKPGNIFNVQKAAQKRLKKLNDQRRIGK